MGNVSMLFNDDGGYTVTIEVNISSKLMAAMGSQALGQILASELDAQRDRVIEIFRDKGPSGDKAEVK